MGRRSSLLALALLVALFGTGAVFAYVSKVDARAEASLSPVTVLVAKQQIPAGTTLQDAAAKSLFAPTSMPRKTVPEGALDAVGSLGGLSALGDIYPGEVLLRAKFGEGQTTGALVIPTGTMAMSVELSDPARVGGFVVPGSEVAIFDTYTADDSSNGAKTTRMLLPRVRVIGVGATSTRPAQDSSTTSKGDKPVASTVLTVAVDSSGAQRLAHAAQTGKLYFALLSKDSVTSPAAGVTNSTLFR